jgi:hypothetical protein
MSKISGKEEQLRDWIEKGKMLKAKYLLILSRGRVIDYYSKLSFTIQQFDL